MESSLFNFVQLLTTIVILYTLIRKFTLYCSRAAIQKVTGAQRTKHYPQWDRIYGLDVFRDSLKAFREHRLLERSQERFSIVDRATFEIKILGRDTIMTLEPQNLKVIQALEHKKWGLGKRRKTSFKPLLGDGKFC
jgi:hypothetical protein